MEKPKREFQEIREEGSCCLGRLIYDAEEMDAFLEEQAVKQREWARFIHNELKELRTAWEDGNETLFLTILENLEDKLEKEARK